MGNLNRQMRRRETREKMREWVRMGDAEKVRVLSQGGIRPKDLEDAEKRGYEQGYKYASTAFFKQMYAAISKELYDAGNTPEEIISFLVEVDRRFSTMFDAEEEIEDVYNLIGVRINVEQENFDRIEVV